MAEHTPPLLAFATGKPTKDWIGIAMHESCHMDQWAESAPVWVKAMMNENKEPMDIIDQWINGKEIDNRLLEECIFSALDIELDCEKRSVYKMKFLGLDKYITPSEYIQKSNAYVLFYLALYKTRQWYSPDKKPYDLPSVWTKMPKNWKVNYRDLNQKAVKTIINECFAY